MIVDFHVHVWPDKIAAKVVARLAESLGHEIKTDGTISGLVAQMRIAGIDKSVVLGVAESPRLVTATNDWLISADDPHVVPFGTVHPDFSNPSAEVERIRAAGLKGIKFHAAFQTSRPDDERLFPIYQAMGSDLIAIFHAGRFVGSAGADPDDILATPQRIARVANLFPNLKIVAAHFGGQGMLDEAEVHLSGKSVYLDTSWMPSVATLSPAETAAFIRRHGVDKVLFGTDGPFTNPHQEIEALLQLPLTHQEKELVLGGNALTLLNL